MLRRARGVVGAGYRRTIELQARLLSRHLQEGVPYKALVLG